MRDLIFVRVSNICNRIEVYDLACDHHFSTDVADIGIIPILIRQIRVEHFFIGRIIVVEKIGRELCFYRQCFIERLRLLYFCRSTIKGIILRFEITFGIPC